MSKRIVCMKNVAWTLVLLLSLVSTCCFSSGTASQTITFLTRNAPRGLDPAIITGWSVRCMDPVYEGLVAYELGTGKTVPRLATSWDISDDGKEVTFQLRENVQFHDGTEFNPEAVKLNFERVLAIGTGPASVLGPVKEVEVTGQHEVTVILESVYPDFLHALTQLYLVSPTAVQQHSTADDAWAQDWFRDNMVGTGPYKLAKWDATAELVLDRFEAYWGGWENRAVGTIRFQLVLEPATQMMMLENGEADIIDQVNVEDIQRMKEDSRFNVQVISDVGMFYIMIRCDKGPLSDRRARLAMTYAFPWEDYIVHAMNGLYPQGWGPIPHAMDYHDDSLPLYKQDLAKAAELFKEAGVNTNGLTLTVRIVEGWAPQVTAAEMLQYSLSSLGIKLNIQGLNWSALVAQARNPEEASDMSMVSVGGKMPSPALLLADSFHSKSRGTAYNWAWYSNPALDFLIDTASTTMDPDQRKALYESTQKLLSYDAPAIFQMESVASFVLSSRVKNFIPNVLSPYLINFYDLKIE